VMYRAGFSRPDFTSLVESLGSDRVQKLQQCVIPAPLVDVSSSDIRNRIARGEDVGDRVTPIVWDYIFRKGLYGRKNPEKGS
jgi:nicotinic acid mononucleotide adenylyltransferase